MESEIEKEVSVTRLHECGERLRLLRFTSQECSMCGDVGFADQLHECPRCRFRRQHSYCCNSKEGLVNGTWICDWCRLGKEELAVFKETESCTIPPSSNLSEDHGSLECLLKAAQTELDTGTGAPSLNDKSMCTSRVELVLEYESCKNEGAASIRSEEMLSHDDEMMSSFSGSNRKGTACDLKRNFRVMRSSLECGNTTKTSQKSKQRSVLEKQPASGQLRRLSSLKSSKSRCVWHQPKGFVRRYKSLSDISC